MQLICLAGGWTSGSTWIADLPLDIAVVHCGYHRVLLIVIRLSFNLIVVLLHYIIHVSFTVINEKHIDTFIGRYIFLKSTDVHVFYNDSVYY